MQTLLGETQVFTNGAVLPSCNNNEWTDFCHGKVISSIFYGSGYSSLPFKIILVSTLPLFLDAVAWRCSVNKMFLKISQNSQEKIFVAISFLIKFIKKRRWQWWFPVNFGKFLRVPIENITSCCFCISWWF